MKEIVKNLVNNYIQKGCPIEDQNAIPRVEIPSAFLFALAEESGFDKVKKKLVAHILKLQTPHGYWEEYSRQLGDEQVPFYGAIATSFAIIALVYYYRDTKEHEVLMAIIRAGDYFCRLEDNGYFLKADNNKSDVLNTNLLAAVALLKIARSLPDYSKRAQAYMNACQRTLVRNVRAQYFSGAYPYINGGLHTPFIYHAMTLGLLSYLVQFFPKARIVRKSIKRGLRFYKKIIDKNGRALWHKDKQLEKRGASWFYGWSAIYTNRYLSEKYYNNLLDQLKRVQVEGAFLANDNNEEKSHLFYTAWTVFALSLALHVNKKKLPFFLFSGYYLVLLIHLITKRIPFIVKRIIDSINRLINGIHSIPVDEFY